MNSASIIAVCAHVFQQTGRRNQDTEKTCEDVYHILESEDLLFYGLADGQSGALCGAEGGRAALEAVAEDIRRRGIETVLSSPFPDELPCLLMQSIRSRLLPLSAEKGLPFREFASTLLAIAIHPATGRYLLLHLGDGCAISVSQDGTTAMRSRPDNGFSSQYTWLTTADTAVAHLRVSFGSLKHTRRLLLLTDGTRCLCQGKNIPRQASALIVSGTPEEIHQLIRQSSPSDDASCILLDVSSKMSPDPVLRYPYHTTRAPKEDTIMNKLQAEEDRDSITCQAQQLIIELDQ